MQISFFRPTRVIGHIVNGSAGQSACVSMTEGESYTASMDIHAESIEALEAFGERIASEARRLLNERTVALRLGPEQEVPAGCREAAP